MKSNEKKTYAGDGGKLTAQNVSRKESQVYFMIEIETEKKSFIQKVKDIFFSKSGKRTVVYLDRATSKHLSSQIHSAILEADKHYKSEQPQRKVHKELKSA